MVKFLVGTRSIFCTKCNFKQLLKLLFSGEEKGY